MKTTLPHDFLVNERPTEFPACFTSHAQLRTQTMTKQTNSSSSLFSDLKLSTDANPTTSSTLAMVFCMQCFESCRCSLGYLPVSSFLLLTLLIYAQYGTLNCLTACSILLFVTPENSQQCAPSYDAYHPVFDVWR